MADLHRRAAGSGPRMSADEIANRGFASAFRGVSETEVRAFLKRVADEVAAVTERESDLLAQIDDLREQLRNPTPLTEQQLLDSLGEETARVLRSAQEAAEDIRSRAEERAATLVREAQDEATQLRESSSAEAERRTEEAERVSSEREQAADAYASRAREDAERDAAAVREQVAGEADATRAAAAAAAEAEVEAAKATGRGLVEEARAVRERVLGDLGRRRTLLQAQVDELRAGRDRLLDAYRVVKRTLGEATDALGQVEVRAGEELAAPLPHVDIPPVDGELEILGAAAEGAVVDLDAEAERGEAGVAEPGVVEVDVVEIVEEIEVVEVAVAVGDDADSGAAVDALFARLRAEKSETVIDVAVPAPQAAAPVEAAEAAEVAEPAADEPSVDEAGEPEPTPEAEAPTPEAEPDAAEPEQSPDDRARAARAEVLDPLGVELTRKAKRSLQDEQNELLDRLRQVKKGRPEAEAVLASPDDARGAWVAVIGDAMSSAYRAGWEQLADDARGPAPDAAPPELVEARADELVGALRERLVAAIDDPADDDDVVSQRLGARFREFKGQELEAAVADLLASTWARGTYDAAPDGTRLRWVPTAEGHCPDCDDNALEPTVRGEPFPTGQPHPPAHPGCRCLLVPADR
jgi:DivIVA domain-containing protein